MHSPLGELPQNQDLYRHVLGINFTKPKIDVFPTRKIIASTLEKYVEVGITSFDTADCYGYRNHILSTFLKHKKREQFQIISKTYFPFPGQLPENGKLSRVNIQNSIDYSLKSLTTDYLDILLAHRFDSDTSLVDTLTALDSEIKKGRILNWGVSEWPMVEIGKALRICEERGLRRPIMNQVQGSFLWRVSNAKILPYCRSEGIAVMAWSTLAQGLSVGSYNELGNYFSSSRMATNKTPFLRHFENQELFEVLSRFRIKHNLTGSEMAELSYFWLLESIGFDGIIINPKRQGFSKNYTLDPLLSEELAVLTQNYAVTSENLVGKDSPID